VERASNPTQHNVLCVRIGCRQDRNEAPVLTAKISPDFRTRALRIGAIGSLVSISFWNAGIAAQTSATGAIMQAGASSPAPVVPQQMLYSGTLPGREGDTVEAVFRIYATQDGGEPMWTETQRVTVGVDGKYSVLLGAASELGLPQAVFAGGQARWLGVSVERAPELPRAPLVSVPYAMKSGDAATLAGRAATDYATHEDLQATIAASTSALQVHPEVTLTGSGTAGYVPLWTSTTNLGNSVMAETGTSIGIDTATPASTLDVNGTTTLRGNLSLPALGTATASGGFSSPVFSMSGSSFKAGGSAVNQKFAWEVQAQGNNTSNPSSALSLLYASGTHGVSNTGLSILPNGSLFTTANLTTAAVPATSSTANPSPRMYLQGSAYSSSLARAVQQNFAFSTIPTGNNTSSPSANLSLQFSTGTAEPAATGLSFAPTGVITFASGQTFPGTSAITAINPSSPVTGGGSSGAVAIGLNESTLASDLEGTYNSVYAGLASNTFSGGQTINGATTINGNNTSGPGLSVSNSGDAYSTAITATNDGEYGSAIYAAGGVDAYGVESYGAQTAGSAGILGSAPNGYGNSNTYYYLYNDYAVGIWADGADGATSALVATADNLYAGIFANDSSAKATLYVANSGSGGLGDSVPRVPGIATVVRTEGPGGMCGINLSGNLSCTGQVKALVSTRDGARQVETYSVQSAENWLEDYGSGQLRNGSVTVALDPAFAETVNTGVEFHVFLTPVGDCKGLYVVNKTPTSFEVHELGGGKSSIPFDYKIVAKRAGHENERLVDVTDRMKLEADLAHPKLLPHGPVRDALRNRARQSARPIHASVQQKKP
jgi:hypothetical protein